MKNLTKEVKQYLFDISYEGFSIWDIVDKCMVKFSMSLIDAENLVTRYFDPQNENNR